MAMAIVESAGNSFISGIVVMYRWPGVSCTRLWCVVEPGDIASRA